MPEETNRVPISFPPGREQAPADVADPTDPRDPISGEVLEKLASEAPASV